VVSVIRIIIIRLEVERSYRKYMYVEKEKEKKICGEEVAWWPGGDQTQNSPRGGAL
jgi:hypothetical protein